MKNNDVKIVVRIDVRHHFGFTTLIGISRFALSRGWSLILEQVDVNDTKRMDWTGKGIDGVIVQCIDPVDTALADLEMPVVNITKMCAEHFHTICVDDFTVGRLGAEHLSSLPLKHFAFLGQPGRKYSLGREEGFVAGLRDAGHSCHRFGSWSTRENISWLMTLPKPVGLMLSNDLGAASLLRACAANHFDVRQQVAIVGVDNETHICEYTQPTLSSVDIQAERIGYEACVTLEAMLKGESVPWLRHLSPAGVVVRESTFLEDIDPRIAEAMRLIRQHAAQWSGVEDLLTHVPMSRRTLERHFHKVLGRTPQEEIQRVRLDEACRLLRMTSLPIEEVAQKSGFTSASWFGKVMRTALGETPSGYRRKAQGTGMSVGNGAGEVQ
ncbi:helix-turn-helix domain-containing protein [Kiritimatiellota bacterium B12222]|nr:helix-turn-helix domain-containing protein [Kiritimatiellota bacterium B12222]